MLRLYFVPGRPATTPPAPGLPLGSRARQTTAEKVLAESAVRFLLFDTLGNGQLMAFRCQRPGLCRPLPAPRPRLLPGYFPRVSVWALPLSR